MEKEGVKEKQENSPAVKKRRWRKNTGVLANHWKRWDAKPEAEVWKESRSFHMMLVRLHTQTIRNDGTQSQRLKGQFIPMLVRLHTQTIRNGGTQSQRLKGLIHPHARSAAGYFASADCKERKNTVKKRKHLSRRTLAIMLTMTMCLSMFELAALADSWTPPKRIWQ